jgi:hypothetical protein
LWLSLPPISPQLHDFLASVKHGEVLDTRHQGHELTVEAHEGRVGIFRSHALEGEADDAGRVEAHAKLQEHEASLAVLLHKFLIAPGLLIPVVVLYEAVVDTQVGHELLARLGITRDEVGGDAAVHHGGHHAAHHRLVGIEPLQPSALGLKESVVALAGKDAVFLEATLGKLCIDIGREDEIVFSLDKAEQRAVEWQTVGTVAAEPDVARPASPVLLLGPEGIERRRVEVGDAVALYPRTELAAEVVAVVADASRRGQPRACSDEHAVGFAEQLAHVGDALGQRLNSQTALLRWLTEQVVDKCGRPHL